jgi:hypothetical protein
VDLHIGTTVSSNSSALEVACPPPGIGAKEVQGISETNFGMTYIIQRSVALESAAVDLHIGIASKDSSALGVACPPPGIRAIF